MRCNANRSNNVVKGWMIAYPHDAGRPGDWETGRPESECLVVKWISSARPSQYERTSMNPAGQEDGSNEIQGWNGWMGEGRRRMDPGVINSAGSVTWMYSGSDLPVLYEDGVEISKTIRQNYRNPNTRMTCPRRSPERVRKRVPYGRPLTSPRSALHHREQSLSLLDERWTHQR